MHVLVPANDVTTDTPSKNFVSEARDSVESASLVPGAVTRTRPLLGRNGPRRIPRACVGKARHGALCTCLLTRQRSSHSTLLQPRYDVVSSTPSRLRRPPRALGWVLRHGFGSWLGSACKAGYYDTDRRGEERSTIREVKIAKGKGEAVDYKQLFICRCRPPVRDSNV